MKSLPRYFRAVVASLLCVTGLSAQSTAPPVRIMPLGDSLTSGVSGSTIVGAYRNRLHTLLTNAGYNVDFVGTFQDGPNPGLPDIDHQGQGSARIDEIQANVAGWLNAVENPDVVLLLIGTNDFWQNYLTSGAGTRLSNLIADIATRRPYAKIIVSSLPPRTDNATINAQQVDFNNAIPGIVAQQVALGRQVSFVDMYAGMVPSDINGDGVHPNQAGSNKMGEIWFPAIANVISPQGTTNPPVIARIGTVTSTQVPVVFSKPVSDASANVANFTIPGVTVTGASLDSATKRTITLTTTALTPGLVYNLTVNGVRDRTTLQTPIAPGSMAGFSLDAITNGGFENNLAGWTSSGNVSVKNTSPYVTTEGTKLVAFNTDQLTPNGILSQTFATTVGQAYQLNFDVGALGYNTNEQRCQVALVGSSSLVSDTIAIRAPNGGATRWVARSYNFTANSSSTTLTFTDVSTNTTNIDLVLDNVRLGATTSRTLAVTTTPTAGANITISPSDLSGSSNGTSGLLRRYNNGATVTVTAPTSLGADSFVRWQRDGVDLPGSLPAISVTMNSNVSLNAVYGSNSAPVAAADNYSVPAGTQLVVPAGGVLTNDFDADGSGLSAVLNAPPVNGTLVLNTNGGFTFTPASGFTGTASFTYNANDGVSGSNIVTVSINVYSNLAQLLVNGSFESDFTGWTRTGNAQIQSAAPYVMTNGSKLAAFNTAQTTPNGILSQSFPTTAGQTYQLAFDVGAFGYNTNSQRIEVKLDGSSNLVTQTFTQAGIGGGNTNWSARTINFTANSSTTTLSFRDTSTTSNSIDLVLDNVRVIGTVPNHNLVVESSPSAGVVIGMSPPDRNAAAGASTSFTRSFGQGTIVNLSAPAAVSGSAFQKWQKNGVDHSTSRNTSVSIDSATTMTAVYGLNSAPVASADSYNGLINTPLVVSAPGVLSNDTDADLNPLTAALVTPPTNGTLVLNPNGGFTYTPSTGYTGADSFTYRASDGATNSSPATVSINIAGITPGTLANGSFELGESGWTMTGNRMVVDSAAPYTSTHGTKLLVFNGAQTAPNGVISQVFNTVSGQAYQLELDMGIVGASGTSQRMQVTLAGTSTLLSQLETINGTGTAAAHWVARTYTFIANSATTTLTLEDKSITTNAVDLLVDNVRLATGNARILTVASSLGNGVPITVTPNDLASQGNGNTQFSRYYSPGATVNLTAPASHSGNGFLKWQKDGVDYANTAATSVSIGAADVTMTAVYVTNSAPVAQADSYTVEMESTLTVTSPGVLTNDSDINSDPITAILVANASNGSVTLNSDGSFIYQPNTGFSGSDSFTYKARDASLDSNIVTVSITVNPFAPGTLVNGSFENDETGWTITGNRLVASSSAPYLPTDGTKLMVANAGNVTPNANISQTIATTPGKTYLLNLDMGILASGSGAVGAQQRLRVIATGNAELLNQLETVTCTAANTAQWTPKSFLFVADSASTTISLLDQSVSGSSRDLLIDNVRCAIRIQRNLTVTSSPNTGLEVAASPNDLNNAGSGTTSFARVYQNGAAVTLTAPATSGGEDFIKWTRNGIDFANTATTTVTMAGDYTMTAVYGSNTAPVAAGNTYTTPEGTTLNVSAPGVLNNDSDIDGTPISAVLVTGPASGTLTLNPDGSFSYAPNSGFSGSDSFTYRASDGVLTSNLATVNITVQATATGALVNGSFEQGETGWTITGNRLVADSAAPYLSTDAVKLMVLNAGQVAANATLSQTFATTPGQNYLLEFDVGAIGTSGTQQRLGLTVVGSSTLVSQIETVTASGTASAVWAAKSIPFTANSATTTLNFADLSTTGTSVDLLLDNVRVNVAGTRTLIVTSPGTGLNVTVSPNDRAGNGNGTTRFHRFYGNNTEVSLTAPATYGGGNFLKWTRNGADYANTAATTVTMDADITMAAVYSSPPQLLTNGSFEQDYTGWSTTGNQEIKSGSPYTATDGVKIAGFNTTQLTPNGVLSQSFPTLVGQTYQVQFDLGVLGYNTNSQRMQVTLTGSGTLFQQTFTVQAISGTMRWVPQALSFVANSTTTTLAFRDTSTTTNSIDLLLDNVRVSGQAAQRTLTIASSPASGANVTVSPNDLGGNGNGTTQFTRTYDNGASVTLTAPATHEGLPFSKWTKNGANHSGTPTIIISADGDHTFTAVYAPNTAPVAVADSYTAVAGSPLNVTSPGVLTNDTDAESNPLTAAVVTNPTSGTLTLNPNGSFTYTPNSGFTGSDSFTYLANDGTDNSNTATVSINVQSVTPGTIVNGSFESDEAGWTMTGNRIVTASSAPYTATNGSKLMVFNGAQSTPNAVISQSIVTVPGQTYAVEFDMGIVGASGSQQRLQLLVGGNTTLVNVTETITGIGVNNARWLPKSFSFVADSATTLITFSDLSTSTQSIDLLLDNVRIITGTNRSLIFNTTSSTPVAVTVSPADLGGGTSGTTTFTRSYNVGTVLSISAPAMSGTASFMSWERNGTQFSTNASTTVTVNGNEFITAVYSSTGGGGGGGETGNTRTLTINSTPTAGSAITVSPADNTGATNGTTNFSRTYPTGTVVSLVAPHQNFVKWLRNGIWYATNPSITVTADSSYTMTAVYTETPVLGPFTNGSFEDEFRGWTWTGSQQTVKVKDGLPATAGLFVIEFNSNSSANNGAIMQTFTTTPGTVYTVNFDQGVLAFNTSSQVLRARVDNASGTALFNQTYSLRGIGNGNTVWSARSFTFTANSATSKITFSDASTTGAGLDLLLDNVRITPPGPGGTIVSRTLTVNSSGVSAVPVTVTPTDNASQGNGTTQFTRTYNEGTSVTLTAPATSGTGTFSKWQRSGTDLSTNRTVSVTMDANYTLTAIYTVPTAPGGALTNASFESGLSGWTVGGSPGAVESDSSLTTTNGTALAKFNGNSTPNDGTLSQTFSTINGATYSVTFDQGVLSYNTQNQIIQAQLTNGSGGVLASQNFTLKGVSNGNINWSTRSLNFVANSTSTTLTFRDLSTTGAGLDMLLDHVRLVKTADPGVGPNVLVNGSFEQSPDYFGWTPTFSTRIEKPGPFYSTNGNNILSFNVGGEPVGGSISQTFPTVTGTTYKIAYDVGVLGYFAKVQRLNMKIMNGATTLLNQTTSITGRADFVMIWQPVEFTFVAQSAATTLVFTDTSTDGGGLDLFVDFVRVNSQPSAAPEPTAAPMASAAFDPELNAGETDSTTTTPSVIPDTPVITGTAGDIRIGMNATEPGRYFLERSDNLLNWNFQAEQTITEPGYIEFQDNSPAESRMFYRIGRNPADTGN
jgi:lysophospholipase L1-like esterase